MGKNLYYFLDLPDGRMRAVFENSQGERFQTPYIEIVGVKRIETEAGKKDS